MDPNVVIIKLGRTPLNQSEVDQPDKMFFVQDGDKFVASMATLEFETKS
jgi:hypothetical protein